MSSYDDALAADPEVKDLIGQELNRQQTTLQLIASENFTSPAVLAATGSVLTNKYSEGYPGRRYYGGNSIIDEVEDLARDRAHATSSAPTTPTSSRTPAPTPTWPSTRPSSSPAPRCSPCASTTAGTSPTGRPASIVSKFWRFVSYGVTPESARPRHRARRGHRLRPGGAPGQDGEAGADRRRLDRLRPRSSTPSPSARSRTRSAPMFMFDAAHPAGLIAGGAHPSPVGIADVVTLTTHKTLRGPRGGAILCGEDLAKKIDSAVFPGLQGGPLEHVIAAKAVAFAEAARPEFRQYAAQVVTNAKALADALGRATASASCRAAPTTTCCSSTCGPSTPTSPARRPRRCSTAPASRATATPSPTTPGSAFQTSGLRLGTAAETTAGMGPAEMQISGRPPRAHPQGPQRRRGDRGGARPRSPRSAPRSRPIPTSWDNACPTSAGTA